MQAVKIYKVFSYSLTIISTGTPGSEGFTDTLKEFKNMKIIGDQYGGTTTETAYRTAENLLNAHPDVEGHCSLIRSEVETLFKSKNVDYELLDLYKMGYDPLLHENELYTAARKDVSKQNAEFQGKISKTDKLIFIYPVWWASMPAILKGFFDRVLVSRFAFQYNDMGFPVRLLKGKKAVVFISSGAPKWLYFFIGSRPAKIIKKDILGFCGIKAKVFQVGGARGRVKERNVCKIKHMVRKGIGYLL